MKIREVGTGVEREIVIAELSDGDLKKLTKRRYFFDWKKVSENTLVTLYKLTLKDDDDIKGVMALINYPTEFRVEILLLTASAENVVLKKERGKKQKEYEDIAGNFIAWAARIAVDQYGIDACISLKPKTELKLHYIQKYGMIDAGTQVFLESLPLLQLVSKYML